MGGSCVITCKVFNGLYVYHYVGYTKKTIVFRLGSYPLHRRQTFFISLGFAGRIGIPLVQSNFGNGTPDVKDWPAGVQRFYRGCIVSFRVVSFRVLGFLFLFFVSFRFPFVFLFRFVWIPCAPTGAVAFTWLGALVACMRPHSCEASDRTKLADYMVYGFGLYGIWFLCGIMVLHGYLVNGFSCLREMNNC